MRHNKSVWGPRPGTCQTCFLMLLRLLSWGEGAVTNHYLVFQVFGQFWGAFFGEVFRHRSVWCHGIPTCLGIEIVADGRRGVVSSNTVRSRVTRWACQYALPGIASDVASIQRKITPNMAKHLSRNQPLKMKIAENN